jgi:peptide/nickel transport system substrate-binding protein
VAMITGGTSEAINPAAPANNIDELRIQTVFDPLVTLSPDLQSVVPMLAQELTPNSNFSQWTFRLRSGVEFTNGKSLTADDLIYTLKGWANPAHYANVPLGQSINYAELKKLDNYTVTVPFKIPFARLAPFLAEPYCYVVQDGEKNFTKPVGTGPFMVQSFTPGQRSVQVRNPNYWMPNRPYADQLQIISFSDPTAQLNALLGGQANIMAGLTFAQAKAQQSGGQVRLLIAHAPGPIPFTMRVDKAPFNDVRVRQAMRLIADRPALINGALSGFGTLGNDLPGPGLPFYASSLPQRKQDIEQAKSLLKAAGREGMTVTLQTSNAIPGFVESATLYAAQATAAGITVKIKQEPASAYFDTSQLYLKMVFAQDSLNPTPGLDVIYTINLASSGPYNETHWGDPSWDALLAKARGSTGSTAQGYWNELQTRFYNEGSYIIWGQPDYVDAYSPKVGGLMPSKLGPLGNWDPTNVWVAS